MGSAVSEGGPQSCKDEPSRLMGCNFAQPLGEPPIAEIIFRKCPHFVLMRNRHDRAFTINDLFFIGLKASAENAPLFFTRWASVPTILTGSPIETFFMFFPLSTKKVDPIYINRLCGCKKYRVE